MDIQPACGCGTGGGQVRFLPGTGGMYYRRQSPDLRRDTCCPLCASGLYEMPPAAAGYYLPAGGDAAADAAAAQRAREAQAAADRDAALRGLGNVLGTANTGISEGFATERARIEADARTAQARAEAQAATERARIEAQRDLELQRLRTSQPNVTLAPLETAVVPSTPSTVSQRTDAGGADSFPTRTVLAVGAVAAVVYFATKSSGGGGRRRKRR